MQAKRDYVWTILGWSFIGNFAGYGVAKWVEKSSRWSHYKYATRRQVYMVLGFAFGVGAFTYYGYGRARQEFVRIKIGLVDQYSIKATEK